ncbi:MAG TPA: TetR/AcrR family transcriptional regulator [Clostridiales bacterium]|nr:TetR/AcrR family transcriptional regulator [Clostridiales bacterium]
MKNEKTDRRVKYTKMVLRESLTKLMQEKPISRITIKELCEDADINRATFYSHYNDQFDLLKKMEQEIIDDINSYLDSISFVTNNSYALEVMTKIFEYIKENAQICRVLLGTNGDIEFQKDIMMIVQTRFIAEQKTKKIIDEKIVEYVFTFAATGSIGMIQKWLSEDSNIPPADMAKLVMKLTNYGLTHFVV